MVAVGSSFFAVPAQHPAPGAPDSGLVVWLRGQHDASNQSALCLTLAHAIALSGPGLVLDLAEVRAISPSTLAVIVRARVPLAAVSVVDGTVSLGRSPAPNRRLRRKRPPGARGQRGGWRGRRSARSVGPRTRGRALRRTPQSGRQGD